MSWFYPIDWASTASFLAALVALGALAWNVWWSKRQASFMAASRISDRRSAWVEEFRSAVARFQASIYNLHQHHYDKLSTPEAQKFIQELEYQKYYIRLLLNRHDPQQALLFTKVLEATAYRGESSGEAKLNFRQLGHQMGELSEAAAQVIATTQSQSDKMLERGIVE